jgi:hypothetical protein
MLTPAPAVELDAVNARHAEGQAELRVVFACGVPSGGRVDPSTGNVTYPIGHRPTPVEIRVDAIENICVVDSEELEVP